MCTTSCSLSPYKRLSTLALKRQLHACKLLFNWEDKQETERHCLLRYVWARWCGWVFVVVVAVVVVVVVVVSQKHNMLFVCSSLLRRLLLSTKTLSSMRTSKLSLLTSWKVHPLTHLHYYYDNVIIFTNNAQDTAHQ